jgi:hypothetical protein
MRCYVSRNVACLKGKVEARRSALAILRAWLIRLTGIDETSLRPSSPLRADLLA